MKYNTFYQHYRNEKEYFFDSIAIPISEFTGNKHDLTLANLAYDADTPEGAEVKRVQLYVHKGATYIDRDVYHVIYQSEDDYDTEKVWVRNVEDFFGMVDLPIGNKVKRFTRLNKEVR
ncbi:hypothetical protein NST86_33550 [Bacillus sp. FSL L8-0199]|uniref:hypothetical protein n=1 Tax=Bacillus sp. FSL L8-0199 TaxID=2954616 RepID=UPI0030F97041